MQGNSQGLDRYFFVYYQIFEENMTYKTYGSRLPCLTFINKPCLCQGGYIELIWGDSVCVNFTRTTQELNL